MGNNNATASLTEEESSKAEETNGMSPLRPVSLDTTQEQVFLASEGKDGDQEKESLSDGLTGKVKSETEPQSEELVEDPKVLKVDEEMHPSDFESFVMENDEQPQKQTSVQEGVETVTQVEEQCLSLIGSEVSKLNMTEFGNETVCEATEVEELSMTETQSFVRKLETTEPGKKEKPCVIDEIVSVSSRFGKIEEKKIDESLKEIVHAEEVVKLDQETGQEQRTGLPEIEPQEILNLEYHVVVDDDEVTNEEKADQTISKSGSQESEAIIQEIDATVYEVEKDMESGREASLKRISRCRSLPVSHSSRITGDSLVKQLVSEVAFPSRHKMGLENTNTSETLLLSYVGSNKIEETSEVITERSKEATLEMRSPSFGSDLRIEERSNEPMEKTPLLCQEKTETYEATIDVEDKTVMLKRSETEKTRGFELSLGLSLIPSGRSEADDSFKETNGSEDNFLDKKASLGSNSGDDLMEKKATLGSMKGRIRKRSKSSILGTCLCCSNFASQQQV